MPVPASPRNRAQRLIFYSFLPALAGGLLLIHLFWGMEAHAAPAVTIRFVDGNGGSDVANACSNASSPCATIQHAITQSPPGDEIRVAQGTYTETIGIGVTLTLKGGYEAAGWTRDIAANLTVIDANGADASVVNITPGANTTVEGFTIQGANHTSDVGGGFLINGATVVISATIIQNNATTGGGGGGIWYEGNNVNVSVVNSSLLNNSASTSGGGIAGSGIVSLNNVEMQGNSAPSGGGLSLNGGSTIITNSQIVSNTAVSGQGGGFHLDFGAVLTITNSSVLSNTVPNGDGGSLWANNATLSLNSVTVQGNQAGFGGGLQMNQTTADITDSQIANNAAATSGGGLSMENNSTVTLNSSFIRGNRAVGSGFSSGGGIETRSSSLTLNDSVIENNVVQSTGGGETLGGAINTGSGSVKIINTIIRNNNSQGTPAVQMYQAVFTVTNSLVVENQGPGFDGSPAQALFSNVTIANNNGSGLGVYSPPPEDPQFNVNVTVVNSILWDNGGFDYSCSVAAGMGGCDLSYSDVGVGDTTGTGNISTDPNFIGSGDYHLLPGSPATDAGTAVGAPGDDLEGNPRDAMPDMGAFEWSGYRLYLPVVIKP